ncbi:MAG: glycosyltransferase family 2 protein [Bacteroidales bacterium]|jgi:glycosyltransferase involved in cell wall biosynthesis|nr:glycosyltransferase family 2 protein [Bacteroidales bacterium]
MQYSRPPQKPLVSVIIPVYNREKTIGYCLNSVVNQTYKNMEILIIDDCSDKNSFERMKIIIDSYNDNRIRLITLKQKSGAQAARNNGIKESTADWITLLDSDDVWILDKIERQIKVLERHNWDKLIVIHSDAILVDTINNTKRNFNIRKINGENVFVELLKGPAPFFQAILTSKKAFELIGYLDENVPSYQEWDTSIKLAKICKFIYLDEPTFYYFSHEGDRISKDRRRDIDGYEYIINKYQNDIKNLCGNKVWYDHLMIQYRKCVKWAINDKKKYYAVRIPLFEKFNLFWENVKILQHLKKVPGLYYLYTVCKSLFGNWTRNDRASNS